MVDEVGEGLKPTIEQTYFKDPATRVFFHQWCEVNDSIAPQFITREEWGQRSSGRILENTPEGKQNLFLPEDLKLWEMTKVIEAVDQDTFAQKPELRELKKAPLQKLGSMFHDSGVYLAQRLDNIGDGKDIAESLAREFYSYGLSLKTGGPKQDYPIENITSQQLTPEQTDQVDKWLLGETAYQKRIEPLQGKNNEPIDPQVLEAERQKLLSDYFKAMTKKGYQEVSKERPWEVQKGPFQHLRKVSQLKIKQAIETPKRELTGAMFRRGEEKLISGVREIDPKRLLLDILSGKTGDRISAEIKEFGWKAGLNEIFHLFVKSVQIEERKLRDELKVPDLREELQRTRVEGETEQISQKELEIAHKIQKGVNQFPYERLSNNPSEMVATQYVNCVGASLLGGKLLQEVGIDYLVGGLRRHSILLIPTSDNKLYWFDMQVPIYREVSSEDLQGLTVADIISFSKNPTGGGLFIRNFSGEKFAGKEFQQRGLSLLPPELGQEYQILANTGTALQNAGRYQEAVEAFLQASALNPKDPEICKRLGSALDRAGRTEEALEAYRKAIKINPTDDLAYHDLADLLWSLGKEGEAIKTCEKILELYDPDEDKEMISHINHKISRFKRWETRDQGSDEQLAKNKANKLPQEDS